MFICQVMLENMGLVENHILQKTFVSEGGGELGPILRMALRAPVAPRWTAGATSIRRSTRQMRMRVPRQPSPSPQVASPYRPRHVQTADERFPEWVQTHRVSDESEAAVQHDSDCRWGSSPSTRVVYERDIAAIHDGVWHPHVTDLWFQRWTESHPAVNSGT